MPRCGCSGDCNCVLTEGACVGVSGNGQPGAPYRISLEIDADADNQAICNPDGLFVPPSSVEVEDTDCIAVQGDGFPGNPILAEPILDPSAGNLLECLPTGMSATVAATGTPCVSLVGNGTAIAPLTTALVVSGQAGNVLQCLVDGAFVPSVGAGAIDIYGAMDLAVGGGFVSPGGTPSVVLDPWPYNRSLYDFGGIVDIANSRFEIPPGGAGWYWIEAQWRDNTSANNFEEGLFGGFFQQNVEAVVVKASATRFPGPSMTQDRLVQNPHGSQIVALRYLEPADEVRFRWTILNSTGGPCGPMAWNANIPGDPLAASGCYATIARVGV